MNDLIRDLGLSKKAEEIPVSRLQEKHLLDDSAKVSYFQKRDQSFATFFSEQKQFVYCHDIPGLLRQLGVASYMPTKWRLFLDSSKQSLKCVLLHNDNLYGGVPVGHFVHLRETYNDIKAVINSLKYHEHNWILCIDLKMVSFLLRQQRGFTKNSCHLCMWDSRYREKHWTQKEWPIHETLEAGTPNIVHDPIVNRDKVVFPPLHIKLDKAVLYMKALDSNGECSQHIVSAFHKLLFDKIKAGVFNGPQIRTLVRDEEFVNKINDKERAAWLSFVAVT